jgi:hypothetical protein
MPEGPDPAPEPPDPERLRRRALLLRELSDARAALLRTTSWRVMTARAQARRRQTSFGA